MIPEGWTGFDRVVPPFLGPDGPAHTARVHECIDREVERYGESLEKRYGEALRQAERDAAERTRFVGRRGAKQRPTRDAP